MEKEQKKEQKKHQQKHSGPKAQKKNRKKEKDSEQEQDARKRNPRAFACQSAVRMARSFHRSVFGQLFVASPHFHLLLGCDS